MKRLAAADLKVPAAAWSLSAAMLALAARLRGLSPLDPGTWSRWDSGIYLDIAARGYRLIPERHELNGHVTLWGGNCGSSPLYPWLIRAVSASGAPLPWAGLALSSVFHFLTLFLLWNGFLKRFDRERALLLMATAAVFPGMVYQQALSPVSLLSFLILCSLLLIRQSRPGWACLTGALAGMTHGAGVFLAPAALAWVFLHKKPRFLAAAAAPAFGVFVVLAVQRLQTGAWDAAARDLEFHRYGPWSWIRLQQMLLVPVVYRPTVVTQIVVIAQSLLTAALCLTAFRLRTAERPETDRASFDLILLCVLVFWLAPHVSPYRHGYYRVEAFLLPVLALLGGLPKKALMAILLLSAALAMLLSDQFLLSILV